MLGWGTSAFQLLYWPVSLLTEAFIHAQSETDNMAGIVFLPPVMLLYSALFTMFAAGAAKLQFGDETAHPDPQPQRSLTTSVPNQIKSPNGTARQ